jgi:hypothetical protein
MGCAVGCSVVLVIKLPPFPMEHIPTEMGLQQIIQRLNSSPETPLPHVNRVITLLKRSLIGTHQGRVSTNHLQHYLDEFVFCHNRRKSRHVGPLFQRMLKQGSKITPVSYRIIVESPKN